MSDPMTTPAEDKPALTPTIGIISEGPTDYTVLRIILAGYFQDQDILPNQLQPVRYEDPGGWQLVLEYCGSDRFRGAFERNQYIILQIDTDISAEHPDYGIAHRDPTGRPYSCEELVQLVCDKLIDKMGRDFYEKYQERIIFAVCVHSLECWLLPLHWTDSRKQRINNCLNCLNEQLEKKGYRIDAKNCTYYIRAAKDYAKHRTLRKHWESNPTLKIFICNMEKHFHRGFVANPADG